MKLNSLSRKLLTRVLSFYFVLTFIVTCVQIGAEYINTKNHIASELLTLEKTFSGSLTRAVWELNTQQAVSIAEGLVAIPMIKGITVTDENNSIIAQLGVATGEDNLFIESVNEGESDNDQKYFNVSSHNTGLFGHTFPLIFEFSGRTTKVGSVTLLSSNEVIFNRIQVGIYFLIGNAMVKTAALVLLFSLAFSSLLTNPLNELTEQINQFDIDDPEASKLHVINYENNELSILQNAYNNLIDELVIYKEKLAVTQSKVISANSKLDEQNLMLEQEVARKTSSLSTTMLKMEIQQRELLDQQQKLQAENSRRSITEKTLLETNHELKGSIIELKKAQERLLDAEKMAVLGTMSAEVTHEINTPIGVSITSTTYLADLLIKLKADIENNKLSKRELNDFTDNSQQGLNLLLNNLERASDLVTSYKQVAVDQISEKIRQINLAKYLDEIIHSLHPKLKKTNHTIKVNCPSDAEIYCHAGAISQIFTNLIINSVLHGFKNINRGEITITVQFNGEQIHIVYKDNGHGLSEHQLAHLFDPFFTTESGKGGTGLGTHIVHNLVTDTLGGIIHASSVVDKGLTYEIKFNNMR
ncbi:MULTISPECIES: HAMP domain-containing sensor histidine kinase [unclassified Colwellia]|jgi:signal transduction histidine kinase|uniref:sensor histidine kinase n=1 Tax=unclassified Colwellia TaxID=196834 RepID=UPI000D3CD8C9|nr:MULTISPECIES: HAMP domain-containing sensor histidine kinase [unclassified Colwellia]AWB58660.1 ATP-binding protein [Colwellia sp. Arc7-D]MBA6415898.1 sensor histidine kinase [Colwellia sp. 6M3]|tara:strand:+ start:2187 stop:3944 length:1758 start_codon:yes stop_codon:yes gene_type:complete